GTGGGLGGGYNFTQDAVLGIQPPTGKPVVEEALYLTQMGSLVGQVSRTSLVFALEGESDAMWVNYNPENIYAKFGAIVEPIDGTAGEKAGFPIGGADITIEPGYGTGPMYFTPTLDLAAAELADGTYKVRIATRDYTKDDSEWVPVRALNGYNEYVLLTKSGSRYTVQNLDMPQLHITDGNIVGTLYYGTMCRVNVTVKNDSDLELAKGFAPVLFYLQDNQYYAFFLGQSVFISVPPHGEVTKEWVTDFTLLQNLQGFEEPMDFVLSFFDESTYGFYTDDIQKPITMQPYAVPNLFVRSEFKIEGAEIVTENVGGADMSVALVKDRYNIPVTCSFSKSGRYPFALNVAACVLQPDFTSTGNQQLEILTYGMAPLMIEKPLQETEYKATITYPQAQPNTYYSIMLAYLQDGYFNQINANPIVFRLDSSTSGIESAIIDTEEAENQPIYNLQGICMGTDWDALPAGLYVRGGKKIAKRL
ncbi:MAG: hypothetical protein NC102_11305, partial [Clostridium sp.]|nr:hypothetical protein [Clostridium sp.]